MGKTITWLHLSDLHAGKSSSGWDSHRVIDTLVKDLKNMKADYGLTPDFIFFTGDAVYGNDESKTALPLREQFQLAEHFFSDVRKAYVPEIIQARVLIVPGNHDVNRKAVGQDQTSWLDALKDAAAINTLLEQCAIQWKRYREQLDDYAGFLAEYNYGHPLLDSERLVFSRTEEIRGVTVGIGGFNTAWSCCREEEKSKLWMGSRWQTEYIHSRIEAVDLSIVLMHHPPNWLTQHEDKDFQHNLSRDFTFALHGHEHLSWVSQIGSHTQIAAGACYERSDKENGYNFVRIDLEAGKGEVFLREYDSQGGGWIPRVLYGKTNKEGIWPLTNFSQESACRGKDRMKAVLISRPAMNSATSEHLSLQMPVPRNGETSGDIMEDGNAELETNSLMFVFGKPSIRELVRVDIAWQLIESPVEPELPLESKTPLLQELRTPQQIRNHFVLLPKIRERTTEWLNTDRDLLFLGLPFCGKTTLLTYLAVEASRLHSDKCIPILLYPREDLTLEETASAVFRLRDSLKTTGLLHEKKHIVLILDNVHTATNFEIARLLMEFPRPWRLWAGARIREYADLGATGISTPWDLKDHIYDACALLNEKEIDFFVDNVITFILTTRGEEKYIAKTREAMKGAGQVPVRFLAQVWKLVEDNRPDVRTGYTLMIKGEPTGINEIVRHIMPQNRPGIDTLTISHYLRKPSWNLLSDVLSTVEGYGREVADRTIANLRETLALLPDSEQPCRTTMYDPIRDEVKMPGNLTHSLKEQIWQALESVLSGGFSEDGIGDDLADSWIALSRLALAEKRYDMSVAFAERARQLATYKRKYEALVVMIECLYRPTPKCKRIMLCLGEMVDFLATEQKQAERGRVLTRLAHCMTCQKNTSRPKDWEGASLLFQEAIHLLSGTNDKTDLADAMVGLAHYWIETGKFGWDKIEGFYLEILSLLPPLEYGLKHAVVLTDMSYAIHKQKPRVCDKVTKYLARALELFDASVEQDGYHHGIALRQLGTCLACDSREGEIDYAKAMALQKRAIEMFSTPGLERQRAYTLVELAACFQEKPQPDSETAKALYQEALDLLKKPDQKLTRAEVLLRIANLLHNNKPIDCVTVSQYLSEAVELFADASENYKHKYGQSLHRLGRCIVCEKLGLPPDYDKAIYLQTKAIEMLSLPDDEAWKAFAMEGLADCYRRKPEPELDRSIDLYRKANALLADKEYEDRRSKIQKYIDSIAGQTST